MTSAENADALRDKDVLRAAIAAHDEYELRAFEHGYKTRPESAVPWWDLPENHRRLMFVSIRAALVAYFAAVRESS